MRPDISVLNGGTEAASSPSLWFKQPARLWEEALPIGNGRLGGMVYGGVDHEKVQLNEDTFWTGSPYTPANKDTFSKLPELRRLILEGKEAEAQEKAEQWAMGTPMKQCSYQPIGELQLLFPSLDATAVTDYKRSLDLNTAIASTSFRHRGVTHQRELFASPAHQVIACSLSTDGPGEIDVDIFFETQQASTTMRVEDGGQTLKLFGKNRGAHGIPDGLEFEACLEVKAAGGTLSELDGRTRIEKADSVVIYLAMSTSFERYNATSADPSLRNRKTLQAADQVTYKDLRIQSIQQHRQLMSRVTIDLGETEQSRKPTDQRLKEFAQGSVDPALAALYVQFGRYLLITSSRPGSQPANLQGIWSDSITPTWDSKFTININTEMNYWPAEPLGLPEMVEPLVAMVRDLAETGRNTAKVMYGARGWACHHNTDLWRATAPIDGPQYGLWPMGGAWLCRHLWDRYDYSRSVHFLESIYPIFEGACQFFIDTLVEDPATGQLLTIPSMSPENRHHEHASVCAGPSMDNQIIRDLFAFTIESAKILGKPADFSGELSSTLSRLRPDSVGAAGQLMEWKDDWDQQAPDQDHRHVSHLYALYPSNQISIDSTPKLARGARQTLLNRGHGGTGWSTAWKINLWARLRDPDNAYANLKELLSPELCYSNMFDVHPPLEGYQRAVFQIDGNLGGAAGVAEMLIQDAGGDKILLLPALPSQWPTGHISGVRLRGGVEARIEWTSGKLDRLVLRALQPRKLVVYLGSLSLEISLKGNESRVLRESDFQ